MAKFDINYANQLPPAAGPSVPAHMNTDTGAGDIWGQVIKAGGALAHIGTQVAAAQEHLRTNKEQLTVDAINQQAANDIATNPDKAQRDMLLATAMKNIDDAAMTPGAKEYAQRSLMDLKQTHFKVGLDYDIKNARDAFETQLPAMILKSPEELAKWGAPMVKLGVITQTRLDDTIKTQPFEANISKGLTFADHPEVARQYIEAARKQAGTPEEMQRVEHALGAIDSTEHRSKQETAFASEQILTKSMFDAADAQKIQDPIARNKKIDEIEATVRSQAKAISPAEARVVSDHLNSIRQGTTAPSDPVTHLSFHERNAEMNTTTTADEVTKFKSDLLQSVKDGKLSVSDWASLSLANDTQVKGASSSGVTLAIDQFDLMPEQKASLYLLIQTEAKGQKLSPLDKVKLATQLAAIEAQKPKPVKEKPLFSSEQMAVKLGALQAFELVPDPKTGEDPTKIADMIREATKLFGPNWQREAPEAVNILQNRFPPTSKNELQTMLVADWNSQSRSHPDKTPAPASQPAATEPTATNPKTGEKMVFRNGKWQPL